MLWVQPVINDNPDIPTIITTHDFLNQYGEHKDETNLDF